MSDTKSFSAQDVLKKLRDSKQIHLTTTGPRDTGQSDYKNRHTFSDLIRLAPLYEDAGYFSVEMHGGARFHQNLLSNMLDPFEEAAAWKSTLNNTLTQTLVRSTNVWGYRSYPENVIRESVRAFTPTIDVWRCFDFLNYVPNMRPLAEEVLKEGKIFEPAISFTQSDECTNEYYLKVAREMVALCGGEKHTIICIKDMAGGGSPERTARLVDAILQEFPELIIHLHRHSTDGLGLPAMIAAAKAGAKIFDVTDDAFVRFYGQAPVRPFVALLKENGFDVNIKEKSLDDASNLVHEFIHHYEPFESQYRGPSYDVVYHRMPGGAFPSSFEQAEKGGFLHLMPWILKGMSFGNRIIRYFDVTPGSQITWTTWAGIIQRRFQEGGEEKVVQLLDFLEAFIANGQDLNALDEEARKELVRLYETASDDLRKLLLGEYGPLPFGWPENWVYRSAFGAEKWQEAIQQRDEGAPPPIEVDIESERKNLAKELNRPPTNNELVLYLQHPTGALKFFQFRKKYGNTSVLPTYAWLYGLDHKHDRVQFDSNGKPHEIRLVSIGKETEDGLVWVVLSVDNVLIEFPVETPKAQADGSVSVQFADPSKPEEVGSPMSGNIWRMGSPKRSIQEGDIVEKDEELTNIEVMKTENAVRAPFAGQIERIHIKLDDAVVEGQILFEITPLSKKAAKGNVPPLFSHIENSEEE